MEKQKRIIVFGKQCAVKGNLESGFVNFQENCN